MLALCLEKLLSGHLAFTIAEFIISESFKPLAVFNTDLFSALTWAATFNKTFTVKLIAAECQNWSSGFIILPLSVEIPHRWQLTKCSQILPFLPFRVWLNSPTSSPSIIDIRIHHLMVEENLAATAPYTTLASNLGIADIPFLWLIHGNKVENWCPFIFCLYSLSLFHFVILNEHKATCIFSVLYFLSHLAAVFIFLASGQYAPPVLGTEW